MHYFGWSIVFLTCITFAKDSDNYSLRFESYRSHYEFDLTMHLKQSPDTTISLLFDTSGVKKFSKPNRVSIVSYDSASCKVMFELGILGYHARSLFKRIMTPQRDSILISMIDYKANWDFITKVSSIEAVYSVKREGEGSLVHYHSRVELDRVCKRLYMNIARRQLESFSKRMFEYLEKGT